MLGFHGAGSSRLAHLGDAPGRAGVRLVLVDRPGYGLSDDLPGRRLLDWPRDVKELADALGLERFALLGYSAGAAHALACAVALPERVSGLALASPAGPVVDVPALRRHLPLLRRAVVELAARAPEDAAALVRGQILAEHRAGARRPPGLESPFAERVLDAELETMARGPAGHAHDLVLLYTRPWGFDPAAVAAPTDVWHGTADDVVAPAIGAWLAETLPSARLHLLEGEDHFLLFRRAPEVLAGLARLH